MLHKIQSQRCTTLRNFVPCPMLKTGKMIIQLLQYPAGNSVHLTLQSLLLWRYSKPAWTRSCAACCRWPCFGRGVGLHDPQRSLPTLNVLWFCDMFQTQFTSMMPCFCVTFKTIFPCHYGIAKEIKMWTSILWTSQWILWWNGKVAVTL